MRPIGGAPPRARKSRRKGLTAGPLVAFVLIAVIALAAALTFRITLSTETVSGVQTPTHFLTNWQQTGSQAGNVPGFVPAILSANPAAPTRLPAGSARYMANAGVAGHIAVVWVFSETVGMAVNTEIELSFVAHYLVVATATAVSVTLYIETQAAAIGATNTYTIYYDTGVAAGITYQSQFSLSQVCTAVGTCP